MPHNPAQAEFEYDAFISYRHTPKDSGIAERLHKALETYRTPGYLVKRGIPRRLKRVFRDRDELPTSGDLGESIEQALAASRYLIVVCSPEALESVWVLREVELFGRLHGMEHVIPLLVAGEPETAFPPSLIRRTYDNGGNLAGTIEPLAADIRPSGKKTAYKLLRTEKLRLLAVLLGCRYDELRQREQERRLRRIVAMSAVAGSFLLAFGAFTLWQLGLVDAARKVAVQNEEKARQNERAALETQSRLYAAMARRAVDDGDRLLGMSLAMEALPKDLASPEKPIVEDAKNALYYASARKGIQGVTAYRAGTSLSGPEDAKRCAVLHGESEDEFVTVGDRILRRYSLKTGRLIGQWTDERLGGIIALSPQADKAVVASIAQDGAIFVRLMDTVNNAELHEWKFSAGSSSTVRFTATQNGAGDFIKSCFSPDGTVFLLGSNQVDDKDTVLGTSSESGGMVGLYDAGTGDPVHIFQGNFSGITSAYFFDNSRFVINFIGDPAILYDRSKGDTIARIANDNRDFYDGCAFGRNVGITPDGKTIDYFGMDELLHIYSPASGVDSSLNIVGPVISHNGALAAYFPFDPDLGKNCFCVYDISNRKVLLRFPAAVSMDTGYAFSQDDKYIVFEDYRVLDIETGELVALQKPAYAGNPVFCTLDDADRHYIFTDGNGISGAILLRDPAVSETSLAVEPSCISVQGGDLLLGENREDGIYGILRWDPVTGYTDLFASGAGEVRSMRDLGGGVVACGTTGDAQYANYIDTIRLNAPGGTKTVKAPYTTDFQTDPSMRLMITNGDGGSKLWDTATGKRLRSLNAATTVGVPYDGMHTVGFFPDGKVCWSISEKIENEYEGLTMQRADTGEIVCRLPLASPISLKGASAVLSGDGSRMLTASMEGLQLWSIDARYRPELLCKLDGGFLCTGETDFALALNDTVLLVDWRTGEVRFSLKLDATATGVRAQFDCGGASLLTMNCGAGSAAKSLERWDVTTGKKLAVLYTDAADGAEILGFDRYGGGQGIAVVSSCDGHAYCRAFPYLQSFEEAYAFAKEALGSRTFDISRDLAGLD